MKTVVHNENYDISCIFFLGWVSIGRGMYQRNTKIVKKTANKLPTFKCLQQINLVPFVLKFIVHDCSITKILNMYRFGIKLLFISMACRIYYFLWFVISQNVGCHKSGKFPLKYTKIMTISITHIISISSKSHFCYMFAMVLCFHWLWTVAKTEWPHLKVKIVAFHVWIHCF